MKYKKSMAAVLIAASVSLSANAAFSKEWKTVNVGVEGAFPPFNATQSNGELVGLDLDIIKEVCKRASLNCNIIAQDWDGQIPSLLAGKFDVVLTMGPNPERRKVIDFSVPYVITPNVFLAPTDGALGNLPHKGEHLSTDTEEGQKALADLKEAIKGYTLGASLSTSQLEFVEDNFTPDAQIRTYKSSEQGKLDLESGRIDAQFDNVVFVNDRAKASNGTLKASGPFLTGGIMATNVCLGIRKDDPELKAILDGALEEMAADGTLSRISKQWFDMDLSPQK